MSTIPRKLYQMENKTWNLFMNKAGASGLTEKIKEVENTIDVYASKLSRNTTKTPATQTLMLCEKIESSIMGLLKDLDKERSAALSEVEQAERINFRVRSNSRIQ